MINLLTQIWAIEAGFAHSVAPTVLAAISRGHSIDRFVTKQPVVEIPADGSEPVIADKFGMKASYDREERLVYVVNDQKQNVAVIPIMGTMTKRGDMCSYGMRDYADMIRRVNASDQYVGAVFEMECPGSTVDGIQELSNAINESEKPIVTFGDHMVASGGYWTASLTDWIVANEANPSEFGSIGVLYVHEYLGKYIEENIGSIEIIRAPQSTDKALVNPIEELPESARAEMVTKLKQYADEFQSTVLSGRAGKLTKKENVFTGKMYPATVSMELGLIDQVGTFQDAVNKVSELAGLNTRPVATPKPQSNQVTNSISYNMFGKLFGISNESAEKLTAEEKQSLADAEGKAAKLEAQNDVLKEQSQAKDELIAELKADNKKKEAEIADLNQKLEETPAGDPPSTEEAQDAVIKEPKLNFQEP